MIRLSQLHHHTYLLHAVLHLHLSTPKIDFQLQHINRITAENAATCVVLQKTNEQHYLDEKRNSNNIHPVTSEYHKHLHQEHESIKESETTVVDLLFLFLYSQNFSLLFFTYYSLHPIHYSNKLRHFCTKSSKFFNYQACSSSSLKLSDNNICML